jgi:hypothetical protein
LIGAHLLSFSPLQLLHSKRFAKIEGPLTWPIFPQIQQVITRFLGARKLARFDPPKGQVLGLHALEPLYSFHKNFQVVAAVSDKPQIDLSKSQLRCLAHAPCHALRESVTWCARLFRHPAKAGDNADFR